MQHLVLIYIGFRGYLSGIQDPRDAADQVDTVRFVKVYRFVIRIQGMQAIFLINLDICFISGDKGADFSGVVRVSARENGCRACDRGRSDWVVYGLAAPLVSREARFSPPLPQGL